jgi:dephospho-CoA kinase
MKIIGLSGTNGAGKDTVGELLAEHHNFLFVSVTEMLRDEARRRGSPVEREVLRNISAQWRRHHGLGVLVDKALEYFKSQEKHYDGLVMSSLRNPGEIDRLHELGGQLIWVDADPKVRYDRIFSRRRGREDDKTFEQFLTEEEAEMKPMGDEATLNMGAVKEHADITIQNNTNDVAVFRNKIEKTLNL